MKTMKDDRGKEFLFRRYLDNSAIHENNEG
jgi:hypothetical protein